MNLGFPGRKTLTKCARDTDYVPLQYAGQSLSSAISI